MQLDPSQIKLSFDTRAEAQAAWIPSSIQYIMVGGLLFQGDSGGDALTTNSGTRGWSPLPWGITPFHWAENSTPGTTDMTAALLAACEFASEINGFTSISFTTDVNLLGQRIGISQAETRGGLILAGLDGVRLHNGGLEAIGTWSGANAALIYATANESDEARNLVFENLNFEGNRKTGCLTMDDTQFCKVLNVAGHGFINSGLKSITSNGALMVHNTWMREWLYNEPGFDVQANRVATGFHLDTADMQVVNCGTVMCGRDLYKGGGYNGQIINFHPWNGHTDSGDPSDDPETQYNAYIDDASNLTIVNLYNDHGVFYVNVDSLHSGATIPKFLLLLGGTHQRSAAFLGASPRIVLHTTIAGNDLAGLSMIGHLFQPGEAENIRFETSGSGSFAANLKWTFLDCKQWDGTPVSSNIGNLSQTLMGLLTIDASNNLTIGRSGPATIRSEGNLMLSADHDNNSGTSDSQIQFKTNGVEIARFKSQGQLDLDQALVLPVFATGSLPDATSFEDGLIFVDDGGAKALSASDGTNWNMVGGGGGGGTGVGLDPSAAITTLTFTLDTSYQNTGSYVKYLLIKSSPNAQETQVSPDGTTWTIVVERSDGAYVSSSLIPIPPGWYYKFTFAIRATVFLIG